MSTSFYRLQVAFPDEEYALYGQPAWYYGFGQAEWTDQMHFESIFCPKDPGHRRSGARIGDLHVTLPKPKVGDFVWTWYSECLMTERVLDLFCQAGFTGFEPRPVTIEKVKRVRKGVVYTPPPLCELEVKGSAGLADPSSGMHIRRRCDACNLVEWTPYTNGLRVNTDTWDGSDFFTVIQYPMYFLVTERVKDLIIREGLANCALVPSEDLISADLRPLPGGSGGETTPTS